MKCSGRLTRLLLLIVLQSTHVRPITEHPAATQFQSFNILEGNSSNISSSWYRTPITAPANTLLCITACCRRDGFGAAFMSHISVFVYSRFAGIDFCSTPWGHLQHGIDGRTMFGFVGGARYGPMTAHLRQRGSGVTPIQADRIMRFPNALYRDEAFVASVRSLVREHYFASPEERPPLRFFDEAYLNVAIHVRRGDIMNSQLFGGKYEFRRVPDEAYLSCVGAILGRTNATATNPGSGSRPARPLAFHIFTDGQKHELSALAKAITRLNLGGSPTTLHESNNRIAPEAATYALKSTFHHLVKADVLLMSRSSLSQAAAFVRPYEPKLSSYGNLLPNGFHRGITFVPAAFGYSPRREGVEHSGGALWGDVEKLLFAIPC